MERPIDHSWEALVQVTNANPAQERGALNRALMQIRQATADLDVTDHELSLMIDHQANLYREVFPAMPMTANSLAKWWGRVEAESARLQPARPEESGRAGGKRKTRGVNQRSDRLHDVRRRRLGRRQPPAPIQTTWMEQRKLNPRSTPPTGARGDRTLSGLQPGASGHAELLGRARLEATAPSRERW